MNPKTHRPHTHRSAAAVVAGGALSLGYATAAFAAPAAAAASAAEAEAAAGEKRAVMAPVTVDAITADVDADWTVLDVSKVTITPLHEQPDQIKKAKRRASDPEVVTTAAANLRVKAQQSSDSLEVLAEGTELGTDADPVTKGDFTRVYTQDGVTGYVATRLLDDYVSPEEAAAAEAAAAEETAAVREVTSSSSSSSSAASAPAASASASSVAAAALSQVGSAYAYSSATPGAFDCSGLVSWAYAQVGISVPHSSSAIRAAGTVISASEAQPGDVIWSPGHVSIYLGNGQQVEAVGYGSGVQQTSIWQSSPVYLRF